MAWDGFCKYRHEPHLVQIARLVEEPTSVWLVQGDELESGPSTKP